MLTVEDALERILAPITTLETIQTPLSEATGLILAQDIIAADNMPPFANSAMDGFALQSQDSRQQAGQPPRLRIIGEVAAGYVSSITVEPGTALRIMTGAPIPSGANTVIQIELTRFSDPLQQWVEILQEVPPGNNIRPAGEDIERGQIVLRRGTEIRAWEIGTLASLGQAIVPVIRPARVAIIGTGDEIIDIDQPLQPGKIRNSNSYLLESAIRAMGAQAFRLGVARDTKESLRELFQKAQQFDLILTSGGVSVGDFDLVRDMLTEAGQIAFWRINMRPGKPVAFGHIGTTPLLGLPGNPVSTAVTFELFGRPLIRKLQGHTRLQRPQINTTIADGIPAQAKRRHYVRAHVSWHHDHFVAHTTGNQGSHILTSLHNANALLVIPENTSIEAGAQVPAIMLDWPEI